MIKLEHIYKSYPLRDTKVNVLNDVNLEIGQNEFVYFLGPSGSGKTTLMNLIGCLDTFDTGKYLLDDEDIKNMSEDELSDVRGKKIGFVFQQFHLINYLNALENVSMPLVYHNVDKEQRLLKAQEMLEKVGLSDWAEHKPDQMSGGQQQRVAIARALVTNPSIILADEPTGNLDSKSSKEIMDIIVGLWNEGNTVVLITHDKDVAKLAKRQILIYDGVLSEQNDSDPMLVDSFAKGGE